MNFLEGKVMKLNKKKILIVSGGTGGHIFPAVALADELKKQSIPYGFATDQRGLEFLNKTEHKTDIVSNIKRTSHYFGKFIYPLSMGLELFKCLVKLIVDRPRAVIGFGGYPSVPCVFAAQILKIPTIIHEGNALLGKANRFLARSAQTICLSFETTKYADKWLHKTQYTGMLVRSSVIELEDFNKSVQDKFNIIIIGGSQGAKIFGDIIPKALALLNSNYQSKIHVFHQARKDQVLEITAFYKNLQCSAVVLPFLNPIADYYKKADFIISRAGASTIAELCIAKLPAILIPFAASEEGDQTINAHQLSLNDAAWVFSEYEITPEKIAHILQTVIEDPHSMDDKREKLHLLSKPFATHDVLKIICKNIKK